MAQLVIPPQCRDNPGFNECHAEQLETVRSLCSNAGYAGAALARCIEHETILRTFDRCGAACPQMLAELARVNQEVKREQLTKKVLYAGAGVAALGIAYFALRPKRKS